MAYRYMLGHPTPWWVKAQGKVDSPSSPPPSPFTYSTHASLPAPQMLLSYLNYQKLHRKSTTHQEKKKIKSIYPPEPLVVSIASSFRFGFSSFCCCSSSSDSISLCLFFFNSCNRKLNSCPPSIACDMCWQYPKVKKVIILMFAQSKYMVDL